jgi:hypothetical protein
MKTNFLLLLTLLLVTAAALGIMRAQSKPQGLGFSPEVVTFTATPAEVRAGEPVTLKWETRGTQSISLEWGPRQPTREGLELHAGLPSSGTMTVTPTTDTIYELRCYTIAGPMCLPISEVVRVK